jgi:type IV pilus assembly protein PilV
MTTARRRTASGFSLIEVLITIVIVSVALLGVAKMQAASVSNTQVARIRSLVALQAGSLAASMHANVAYWGSPSVPTSFTASGSTISNAALNGSVACGPPAATGPCTPVQMAGWDLLQWRTNLNQQIPTFGATVTCVPAAIPVTCVITLTWYEKYIATNSSTAAASAAQVATSTYSLFVTP